jgi:NAD(P)-dependent dehydrogenase (short-subunit alcohol dehydrogenase family)
MQKVVFITGAATGIGKATAEILHKQGWQLALFDVNTSALEAIRTQLGDDVAIFTGSVTDMLQLQEAVDATVELFGRIDAVWANAGIAKAMPLMLTEEDDWLRVIDVNLNGVYRTIKATAPHIKASQGYVLITSSITSALALPFASGYSATKAAVLNLADAYRTEMSAWNVEVGTIHPTFIRTPLIDKAIYEDKLGTLIRSTSNILFFEFPLSWAASTAAKMINKRKRRDTVPSMSHLPFIWLPRLSNVLMNLWAFRRPVMQKVMSQALEIHEKNQEK